MDLLTIILVIGVGFLAGFINTMAGGGSLISLPLLIFAGLPANVANGTNRIAILLQNAVSTASFKQQKVFTWKEAIKLAIPTIIGSIIGALLGVNLNEELMNKAIGALLLIMIVLMSIKKDIWLEGNSEKSKNYIKNFIVFFFIGIYGGFIQAGVGFFLTAGLVLSAGFDLLKSKAIKVFIILLYTPFALFIFIMNDQVNYKIGLILAIGNMAGAFLASRLAIKKGSGLIRWFMIIVIAISSTKLLGLWDLIANWS